MNLKLIRTDFTPNGIFGELRDDNDSHLCYTVEHAYSSPGMSPSPKVPSGSYLCVRGQHQLEHGGPFETFEVTGVVGHTGILFHRGNKNEDSDGCILLGLTQSLRDSWIGDSILAFHKFLLLQTDTNEFTLTVENK